MLHKDLVINPDPEEQKKSKKFNWYWSPVFIAVWFVLYYVAAIPSFYSYPDTLLIRDERRHPDEFIGERAQMQLLGLSMIGVKLTGTVENEVMAVQFLLNEIDKIKSGARHDLYDIEVDVQYSSGNFMLWELAQSYHNVTNVVVKISPKNTRSESYLLVNSHFDSEVGSPAAADAGVMIVAMLETLRVISISEKELKNPIVFLLNGAEESKLLGSHGFITSHKWARYCKALINLDSMGTGGREILFQTGPDHPWLIKYYKKAAKHPYATTIAEELFQNKFIPSDTDFGIFRDHGGVPGLDMAHALNGYMYHTKYDSFQNMQRGTYQTTGDNVLALTWALANAEELTDPDAYAEGHAVYYDYLGWFLITYTETSGIVINVITCGCASIFIGLSVFLMTKPNNKVADRDPKSIYIRFLILFGVQVMAVLAAVGLTILIAVIIGALGLAQSWYYSQWLIFGLYFCPIFFALTMIPALHMHWTREKNPLDLNETIACFMHAHCMLLALICTIMTSLSIRSSFFPMIAVFFYTISVILNMIAKRFCKKSYYIPIHLIFQLLPFWFYTYWTYVFLNTFIPMQGRSGPDGNPEYFVSIFVAIFSLHFAGFILPILHKFRKSKLLFSVFGALTIVFIILAATPVGFPYKKDVAAQRIYALHTERAIHDYDGKVIKHDTGFYIQPVDSRPKSLADTTLKNALPDSWTREQCESEPFCGLPLYSTLWRFWKDSAMWVPAAPPSLPIPTELTLTSKDYLSKTRLRYEFSLKAVNRVVIYVDPYPQNKVINWSFNPTPLVENYTPPYFMYHAYSMVETPMKFWLEVERDSETYEGPSFRLGVGAHFLYDTSSTYTDEYKQFLASFPEWSYPINWVASYEGWHF